MRRLLLLVAVLVFVDTMLFAALTPLLPHFADELGLSKTRAGALVAAYAAGALVGGVPGGFAAARLGARRAVIVGLTAMGLASVGFALAGGFWTLFAARLLQGCGSAFTWAGAFARLLAAAPRERRGALIGSAMGAAIFGALFGPVIGAAAAIAGRDVIFCALAALAAVLVVWTLRLDSPPPGEQPSGAALLRALRNRQFAGGLTLMAVPSLLFGILSVLGPLHLSNAGWGAAAIGGVWLVGAASRRCRRRSSAASWTSAGACSRFASRLRPAPCCRSASRRTAGRSSTCRLSCSLRWRTACCSRRRSR